MRQLPGDGLLIMPWTRFRSRYRRDVRRRQDLPLYRRVKTAAFWLAGPIIAVAVIYQWFAPGRLLAGGDVFPITLINPPKWIASALSVWDITGPLGGPADLAKSSPDIILDMILRLVLPAAPAHHLVYIVLFGGQFLGMAFLSLTLFPGRRLGALLAALFYCFNPFMVLVPPNNLVMFFLAFLPYINALFIRCMRERLRPGRTLLFVVSAGLSGYLFNNPPLFALALGFSFLVALGVAIQMMIMRHAYAVVLRRLGVLVLLFILANLYWIVPSYFALFGVGQGQAGGTTVVAAGAIDWAWTASRSSMLNMFWLNPIWAWTYYYPYAPTYKTLPLLLVIFLPTLLAFSTLLFRQNNVSRAALPVASVALVFLLLATGLHGPWQDINLFLFQHVPGFWLFREPDGKFTPLLLMLYAPLVGWQGEQLANGVARLLPRRAAIAPVGRALVAALLSGGFVLAAFPLVTGAIFGRTATNADKVGTLVPPYWYQLKDYLSAHDSKTGVLVLPNDDSYQMPYTWGYYGTDALGPAFIPNPIVTLTNAGEGYLTSSPTYDGFNSSLLKVVSGDASRSLTPYLAAQNVGYILQRNDVDVSKPGGHILNPQQIRSYLSAQPHVRLLRSFGLLDLYAVDKQYTLPPAYAVAVPARHLVGTHWQQRMNVDVFDALSLPTVGASRDALRSVRPPRVLPLTWSRTSPTRMSVSVDASAGPAVVVLTAVYHPGWHACIVPEGSTVWPWTCWFNGFMPARDHVQALGFANGWVIEHPGRYTIVMDYGFQHVADVARLLSILAVGCCFVWPIAARVRTVRRRAHRVAQELAPHLDVPTARRA